MILSYDTAFVPNFNDLEAYAIGVYRDLESANLERHSKTKQYLSELNLKSNIPDPSEQWRSSIRSSMFYQKVIFAYNFLRSLLNRSTRSLLTFESKDIVLASALRKIYEHAVQSVGFYDKVDKAFYNGLLSGQLVLYIDVDYVVDQFGDIEKQVVVDVIPPLDFYTDSTFSNFAVDRYITLEKVSVLRDKLWQRKDVPLEAYHIQTKTEQTEYLVKSLQRRKHFAKLSYIFTRYEFTDGVDSLVSIPYKLVILNDKYLVDYQPISHLDNLMPIVAEHFYSEDVQLSYADLIWDYYKEDTRLMRVFMDRAILSTAMALVYDASKISTESKVLEIKPFSVIQATDDVDKALRTLNLATFDPNILPVRQMIMNEAQNMSGITEFIMGQPTSKGRATAKEVMAKTQQGMQILSTIIKRIEDRFISKSAKKLLSVYLQYKIDEIMPLLTPEEQQAIDRFRNKALLKNKPDMSELIKELYKGVVVNVGGMTAILNKKEEADNILNLFQLASELRLVPFFNVPLLLTKLLEVYQLSSDVIRIPTQEEWLSMIQQQTQQESSNE